MVVIGGLVQVRVPGIVVAYGAESYRVVRLFSAGLARMAEVVPVAGGASVLVSRSIVRAAR